MRWAVWKKCDQAHLGRSLFLGGGFRLFLIFKSPLIASLIRAFTSSSSSVKSQFIFTSYFSEGFPLTSCLSAELGLKMGGTFNFSLLLRSGILTFMSYS